jgi:hypothetical protein
MDQLDSIGLDGKHVLNQLALAIHSKLKAQMPKRETWSPLVKTRLSMNYKLKILKRTTMLS